MRSRQCAARPSAHQRVTPPSRHRLLKQAQSAEVAQTAGFNCVLFMTSVASPASWEELSFAAAVDSTDRCPK
jgi:hypothetical protein